MSEPIDWPTLYYESRDPELHEAGARYRAAVERVCATALEWASRPDEGTDLRTAMFGPAIALRNAKDRLDAIGARLWAERDPATEGA